MLISGIQQFTLLDYPDKTACIVFTPGCNFRCGYCHNPEFVLPERIAQLRNTFIPEIALFNFLRERQGILDGVVITGGEPTLRPDIIEFMEKIKSLGFLVKLDTNGNRPEIIKRAMAHKVVDYIAMDIKTNLVEYPKLVGKLVSSERLAESVAVIMQSSIDYEFRSTLIKEVHSFSILQAMAELVRGARRFYLQTFRPANTLNPIFQKYHPFSGEEMENVVQLFRKEVKEVWVR